MRRRPFLTLLLGAAACAGAPEAPGAPESTGRGIVEFDREPPAGAATWQRPLWRVGEKFVLRRGERVQGEFRVTAIEDGAYVLDTGGGPLLRRDLDLGNLGEWAPDGTALRVLAPVDARYHWPLWVGKRWTCEFVDRARGAQPLAMQASYLVEDLDTITVPGGTFEALRIVRTVRLAGTDRYLTRTQIAWYAPAVGTEVRQLAGDTLFELAERVVPE